MTEPAILVLRQPLVAMPDDSSRAIAPAGPCRSDKARRSFQPIEQVLTRLELFGPGPSAA